jgi:hypothetical protein
MNRAINLHMDYLPTIAALERTGHKLEALLGQRMHLVEREAVEASRNPIRRCRIPAKVCPLYAA